MSAWAGTSDENDVTIEHTYTDYEDVGTGMNDIFDLAIDDGNGDLGLADGESLLCIVGIDAPVAQRSITSVKLIDNVFPTAELSFIKVGEIDDANNEVLLAVYKIDNKSIETNEGDWRKVEIEFPQSTSIDHTYACLFILDNQMLPDMIRNFQTDSETTSSSIHNVDTFVLEPDAIVITATMWHSGAADTDFSTNETQKWEQEVGTTDGIFIYYDAPDIPDTNNGPQKNMSASAGGGVPGTCKSISVSVVIRSDTDFTTTHGNPGALGNGWWYEGINRNAQAQHDGDEWALSDEGAVPPPLDPGLYDAPRSEITDTGGPGWGSRITTGQVVWIPTHIHEGNQSGDNVRLLSIPSKELSAEQINILAFSPLNEKREEYWANYINGVEEDLDELDNTGQMWEHITWSSFTGLVVWDQERYALHFGGTQGVGAGDPPGPPTGRPDGEETTKWGPNDKAFDVTEHDGHPNYTTGPYDSDIDIEEWEYNACVRYYWEKLHQWSTEKYAPNVEALIQYNIPQAPNTIQGRPAPNQQTPVWKGVWWDDNDTNEISWVYKMQGGFDGHMYPPINLNWNNNPGPDQVVNYVSNSIIHYREYIDVVANGNPYGYLTMWNGHPGGFAGHHIAESLRDTIETFDDARRFWALADRWSNFNAIMYHPIGIGGKQGETTDGNGDPIWIDYDIDSYVDEQTIKLNGEFEYEFDPEDNNYGGFGIYDPSTSTWKYENLEIDFGSTRYPTWPLEAAEITTIIFTDGSLDLADDDDFDTWVLRRPNKTINSMEELVRS